MKSYIIFFSFVSVVSAVIGFGFDGEVPNIFRIIFVLAIDLVLILALASFIFKKVKKVKAKKRVQPATVKEEVSGQTVTA